MGQSLQLIQSPVCDSIRNHHFSSNGQCSSQDYFWRWNKIDPSMLEKTKKILCKDSHHSQLRTAWNFCLQKLSQLVIVQEEMHHARQWSEDRHELKNGIDQWGHVSFVINRSEREYWTPADEKDAEHEDHMFQQWSIATIAVRLSTTERIRVGCIIAWLNAARRWMNMFQDAKVECQ